MDNSSKSTPQPESVSHLTPPTSQNSQPSSTPTSPTIKSVKPSTSHVRGPHGRFISKGATVSGLLSTETTDDDSTLVDVKVNNPLHKITQILEQIKAHQSTTVSLRFTIPLIALPIVLLAAFQLGRVQTLCSPVFTSQVGNLQMLSLEVPKADDSWYSPFLNLLPGNFVPQKTVGFLHEFRAVLLTSDGGTLSLVPTAGVDLTKFHTQQVIVSGNFSACNKAITIDSPSNIQQLQ